MWTAVSYVSSGLTLVAFLAAVGASLYRRKMAQLERMIACAAEADRARLVASALEVFHVDTRGLTKVQQYQLALEQIRAREVRYRVIAKVIVVVSILAAGVAIVGIAAPGPPASTANIEDLIRTRGELRNTGSQAGFQEIEQTLRPFARLEKLLAIYSLVAWVSPQQKKPYIIGNDAFGDGDAFSLDCADIGEGNHGIKMGELFRCFAEPITVYVPRAGEEVETTVLVANEDFWYRFKWHSIFGYEMNVVVNPADSALMSLADGLRSDASEEWGPVPAYAVEISDYGHSDASIRFVVRVGSVDALDNGAVVVDQDEVEIHFASGDMITGGELVKAIRMLLRELGVDAPDLTTAALRVQSELLRMTPSGIGRLTETIKENSRLDGVLDSL